jgi:hypothetical protein
VPNINLFGDEISVNFDSQKKHQVQAEAKIAELLIIEIDVANNCHLL